MGDSLLAITVIWGFIFIYAVMGTMDFGAGFWSMVYINRTKTNATDVANRYLSPTWEVTNVFIVAIVVALFSFFPSSYIYAWHSVTNTRKYHFTSLIYSKRIFSVFTLC